MGCDIHLYKEKKVNGEWVSADVWEKSEWSDDENVLSVPYEKQFNDRNYQLFGLLSNGVRSSHSYSFEARGLPFNTSREVRMSNENWDCDGHSHSYLYLHELKDVLVYSKTQKIHISGMKDRDELALLEKSAASDNPNWDLLWPYCQGTNQASYVHFEIDIPASLYFEKPLTNIIESFDGIEADNHRIVFWFDN